MTDEQCNQSVIQRLNAVKTTVRLVLSKRLKRYSFVKYPYGSRVTGVEIYTPRYVIYGSFSNSIGDPYPIGKRNGQEESIDGWRLVWATKAEAAEQVNALKIAFSYCRLKIVYEPFDRRHGNLGRTVA